MAVFAILSTILALPAALFAWSALSLRRNKAIAEKVGLPLLVRWVTPTNPLWMVFGSSIVRACRAWNIGTAHFRRYYFFGWEANERHQVHEDFGDIFITVSPGGNWLCVSDAAVIDDIIRRPKDFRRNMKQFAVVNVYGKNLSTTDDAEWQKHRKVTAVTFTEKNNELVWRESLAQSKAMREFWIEHQPVRTVASDAKIFTLNVLAAALFDKVYPFKGTKQSLTEPIVEDDSYKYRDSLSTILASIVPIFVFGEKGLRAWWTPTSFKKAADAVSTFRSYVLGLMDEERQCISRGAQHNQHLVANLVRACETDYDDTVSMKHDPGRRKQTLTQEEIVSNLFVYAFAGNDTTAVTLAHMLVFLAAHPETQGWIAEELRHFLPGDDPAKWDYRTFPQLQRCLAVVMEALRLVHPLSQLVKTTNQSAQTIVFQNTTYIVPADTNIHLSLVAVHTHPRYWGSDSLKWNPKRFISLPTGTSRGFEHEVLAHDTSASFFPWAYGQRLCPGKKFSQVELVATLAILFRDHQLHPQCKLGESMDEARKRTFKTGLSIDHEGHVLHEMEDPASVGLVWERREN